MRDSSLFRSDELRRRETEEHRVKLRAPLDLGPSRDYSCAGAQNPDKRFCARNISNHRISLKRSMGYVYSRKIFHFLICSDFLLGSAGTDLRAGGATGAITGTVQDPSGGAIASAKVENCERSDGPGRPRSDNGPSGSFTATLLPVGSYSVGVSAAALPRTKFTGVLVRVTETTRMTAALKSDPSDRVGKAGGNVVESRASPLPHSPY